MNGRTTDYDRGGFVAMACALSGFGVLMVYSASITSWPSEFEQIYLSRHLMFLLLGSGLAAICALMPARFWFKAAPWLLCLTVILLLLVLVPGVGTRVNGAQRWLRHGPFSLQPSELAKLALPLFLCRQIVLRRKQLGHWIGGTLPLIGGLLLTIPLVLMQPDLGTSLFLTAGGAIALFVGGWPIRYFLVSAALAVPAFGFLVAARPYQIQRITGFLAAWNDWNDAPYQLQQSLVSMGAGGLLGVGLGSGWQKLSFLPEANTDFVFAVVGEELGLVGTLSLLTLWAGFYVTGLRLLARLHRPSFAHSAGVTLLTLLVLQAALNMAVVVALVPPKGIPHPLISYGGSNLVVSLIMIGVILSLSKEGPNADTRFATRPSDRDNDDRDDASGE